MVFYELKIPLRSAFFKELFDDNYFASVNAIRVFENQVVAIVTGLTVIVIAKKFGVHSLALLGIMVLILLAGGLSSIRKAGAAETLLVTVKFPLAHIC